MLKRIVLLIMIFMVIMAGSVVWSAPASNTQVGQAYQEMRKNLTWLAEGLNGLGNSGNSALKLTAVQRKKILPVFESLVHNNLIMLTLPETDRQRNNSSGFRSRSESSDSKVQARLSKIKDQIEFGNRQADLIDSFLTEKQLSYIDNLDFNPEKYGFLDFQKLFGSDRRFGGDQRSRPDQKTMEEVRTKARAGQELLIRLNNQVLKMLKS